MFIFLIFIDLSLNNRNTRKFEIKKKCTRKHTQKLNYLHIYTSNCHQFKLPCCSYVWSADKLSLNGTNTGISHSLKLHLFNHTDGKQNPQENKIQKPSFIQMHKSTCDQFCYLDWNSWTWARFMPWASGQVTFLCFCCSSSLVTIAVVAFLMLLLRGCFVWRHGSLK